ncbi:MAG TPA: Hsp70 family protein, partial [bacterium]|nr:Hsp70 family protein [bacterium]
KKMMADAESHAAEDKAKREEIDTRNRLDSLTYEVDKNSKEWADRLAPEMKSKLEGAVERARKALRGEDLGEIRSAREELEKAYSEAGQSLYAAGQQAAGDEATARAANESAQDHPKGTDPKGGAVDADYEIVDEKK